MAEKSSTSSMGERRTLGEHPLREVLHRFSDPRFVLDSGIRAMTQAWDSVSPSPFSVLYRKVRAHTMCSNARLRSLHEECKDVVKRGIPGAIVECGCARGGSVALMALTLKDLGERRDLWLFDTFEGLPAPTQNDPDFEIADAFTGTCVGTLEDVRSLFVRLEVEKNVHMVKGLFQDTLASADTGPIALLHIDGDWYDSVRVCLEALYDRVTPGGVIQFDDYGYWRGARKAVDEFLQKRELKFPLRKIDYSGRCLTKVA
jgi:Macrocin-O-methyltransferase (TylF)